MLSHTRDKGDRVVKHICSCGAITIGFAIHTGNIPIIKCKTCSSFITPIISPVSIDTYATVLWYKPCKERRESDASLVKANNTLVKYKLSSNTNCTFLDVAISYAIDHFNVTPLLDNNFHPIIRLIWELMRDDIAISGIKKK
jgi:hypothetical protein